MTFSDRLDRSKLSTIFFQILRKNLSVDSIEWLEKKTQLIVAEDKSVQLHLCFAHLPRIASKKNIALSLPEIQQIQEMSPGLRIDHWSLDQLSRVWLLMQLPTDDRQTYVKKINSLFTAAEMNEQIALYSALPVYNYPEEWIGRCEEGIRSNIGTVLEAIMYHNPYPSTFLSEPAWNQLVLKAFFTEKNVNLIIGLNKRVNERLVATLKDYIQERLAANRSVAPEIYQLTQQMNHK